VFIAVRVSIKTLGQPAVYWRGEEDDIYGFPRPAGKTAMA
jgi:hypothetical protein